MTKSNLLSWLHSALTPRSRLPWGSGLWRCQNFSKNRQLTSMVYSNSRITLYTELNLFIRLSIFGYIKLVIGISSLVPRDGWRRRLVELTNGCWIEVHLQDVPSWIEYHPHPWDTYHQFSMKTQEVLFVQIYVSILRPSRSLKLPVKQYHLLCLRKKESHLHASRKMCASQEHDHRGLHHVEIPKKFNSVDQDFCCVLKMCRYQAHRSKIASATGSIHCYICASTSACAPLALAHVRRRRDQTAFAWTGRTGFKTYSACIYYKCSITQISSQKFVIGQQIIISDVKDHEVAWIDTSEILTALEICGTVQVYYYNAFGGICTDMT